MIGTSYAGRHWRPGVCQAAWGCGWGARRRSGAPLRRLSDGVPSRSRASIGPSLSEPDRERPSSPAATPRRRGIPPSATHHRSDSRREWPLKASAHGTPRRVCKRQSIAWSVVLVLPPGFEPGGEAQGPPALPTSSGSVRNRRAATGRPGTCPFAGPATHSGVRGRQSGASRADIAAAPVARRMGAGGQGQGKRDQWLSRGMPLVWAMRWYFTAGSSTAPVSSSVTRARWISCQGVWLGGYW
jgi:hypothetical protein